MQSSILNQAIVYLIIIFQILISSCKTQVQTEKIELRQLKTNNISGRITDILLNNNKIVLHNTEFGIDNLIFIDRNNNKKNTIDLIEKGLKNPTFLKLNRDNSVFLLRKLRRKNDKIAHAELVKIDITGKIIFRTNIPFIPQGMFGVDSLIYILGKYKGKALHVFDGNGKYNKSFLNLNQLNLPKIPWQLEVNEYRGKTYISSAENYLIWVIENSKLIKTIKFRNDTDLIERKSFGNKKKIYRMKGIHDFFVRNDKIYVSCFAHSQRKTKYWYDIVDINTGKLIETVNTKFLYYFSGFNDSIYVWHNYPKFELFKATI